MDKESHGYQNKNILVVGGTGFSSFYFFFLISLFLFLPHFLLFLISCYFKGYIGSHTIVVLINEGYDVTIIDNLINSSEKSLERVQEITNCDVNRIRFFKADLRDSDAIESILQLSPTFSACIHFAGLKVYSLISIIIIIIIIILLFLTDYYI